MGLLLHEFVEMLLFSMYSMNKKKSIINKQMDTLERESLASSIDNNDPGSGGGRCCCGLRFCPVLSLGRSLATSTASLPFLVWLR